jgi:hypothetical protein
MDGNALFAQRQSAFSIDTKLTDQMGIVEVAFVVVGLVWIEGMGEGSFAGSEGFEHDSE